jgi:hypothetical protein
MVLNVVVSTQMTCNHVVSLAGIILAFRETSNQISDSWHFLSE